MNISQWENHPSRTREPSLNKEFEIPIFQGSTIITINILLIIFGTFGNTLILFAVLLTPNLRKRPSNRLLLSLAVADLVVTTIAQPLFVTSVFLKVLNYDCISEVDVAYGIASFISGGSSVTHLAFISIDRGLSAFKPHQHLEIMTKYSLVFVLLSWGIIAVLGTLYFSVQFSLEGENTADILSILDAMFIALGFLPMVCSYCLIIYKITVFRVSPGVFGNTNVAERVLEKKVSTTIGIVILLFLSCWVPPGVYRLMYPNTPIICSKHTLLAWIRTIYLANSSMNFVVYSWRIRQFRAAYLRIMNRLRFR